MQNPVKSRPYAVATRGWMLLHLSFTLPPFAVRVGPTFGERERHDLSKDRTDR